MKRRQFLRAGSAGAFVAVVGCLGRGPSTSGDEGATSTRTTDGPTRTSPAATDEVPDPTQDGGWPMADFAASATGHNPDASTAEPSATAWTLSFREHEWVSDPAVDASTAYVGVKDWAETPATTVVRAHALDGGSETWTRSLPYAEVFAPALGDCGGDDAVFVVSGQDNSNTDHGHGEVRALSRSSGDRLWAQSLDIQLVGPPVVARDRVFVPAEGLGEGGVYALDASSGEEDWFFDATRDPSHSPTVADDTVFVHSDRDELAALDAETGDVDWRRPANGDTTRPVVNQAAGLVYVGYQHGLQAFEADTGESAWAFEVTDPSVPPEDYLGVTSEPVLAGDTLYVRTSDTSGFAVGDPGELYALDAATGDRRWQLGDGHPVGAVVGADDHAILSRVPADETEGSQGSDDAGGEMVCVTPEGDVKWTGGPWEPMAVGNGYLFCHRGARWSAPGTTTFAAKSV